MADLTTDQFEAARTQGDTLLQGPRAESVHYDARRDRVIVRLTTGVEIGFAPRDAQGLRHASREDLATIELEPFGLGIHFPRLDADVYVPALLQGLLGSTSWMEARHDASVTPVRNSARTIASHVNRKLNALARQNLLPIRTIDFSRTSGSSRAGKVRRSSLPLISSRRKNVSRQEALANQDKAFMRQDFPASS